MGESSPVTLEPAALTDLFDTLHEEGYEIVGPTVREGAIVYETLQSPSELPRGVGDEQAPGSYRLRERGDSALFAYAVRSALLEAVPAPAARHAVESAAHRPRG